MLISQQFINLYSYNNIKIFDLAKLTLDQINILTSPSALDIYKLPNAITLREKGVSLIDLYKYSQDKVGVTQKSRLDLLASPVALDANSKGVPFDYMAQCHPDIFSKLTSDTMYKLHKNNFSLKDINASHVQLLSDSMLSVSLLEKNIPLSMWEALSSPAARNLTSTKKITYETLCKDANDAKGVKRNIIRAIFQPDISEKMLAMPQTVIDCLLTIENPLSFAQELIKCNQLIIDTNQSIIDTSTLKLPKGLSSYSINMLYKLYTNAFDMSSLNTLTPEKMTVLLGATVRMTSRPRYENMSTESLQMLVEYAHNADITTLRTIADNIGKTPAEATTIIAKAIAEEAAKEAHAATPATLDKAKVIAEEVIPSLPPTPQSHESLTAKELGAKILNAPATTPHPLLPPSHIPIR